MGTAYNGWQVQPNAPTVQERVERALALVLRAPTAVTGAGRTDTGVHACDYTAHFDATHPIADPAVFLRRMNSVLPPDIAVHRLDAVYDEAHARFSALERSYTYNIIYSKDPFRTGTAWLRRGPLDLGAMNLAAQTLAETDDFTTFAKLDSGNRTNICCVRHARWEETDNGAVFGISADRFLRNMVRAIVGTLVDVGRGRLSPEDFRNIVAARDLSLSSTSAPARGLFFSGALYPESIYANR